nr:mucin-2-like [Leptinotarsa decemlineata]
MTYQLNEHGECIPCIRAQSALFIGDTEAQSARPRSSVPGPRTLRPLQSPWDPAHHTGAPPTASPSTPIIRACMPPPPFQPLRMRAPVPLSPLAHARLYPKESTPQHSVRRVNSSRSVQSSPVNKQNFEMQSNTQEVNNAVASIMLVVNQEKATTSSGSWPTARKSSRPSTSSATAAAAPVVTPRAPAAAVTAAVETAGAPVETPRAPAAAVETLKVPSPEDVVLTPLAVPLSPLPPTPANLQVLVPQVPVPQPIGEVSEKMKTFLQRCREAEHASRASEAALVSMTRQKAEIANRRSELDKGMAELDRKYASLEERYKAETSSIERTAFAQFLQRIYDLPDDFPERIGEGMQEEVDAELEMGVDELDDLEDNELDDYADDAISISSDSDDSEDDTIIIVSDDEEP